MCPATFSPITQAGLSSSTSRYISGHKWRSSPAPSRFPAKLKGWHGYPPQIRSTAPTLVPFNFRMSSCSGTSGQCFANTFRQYGSISQNATVSNPPARSRPSEKPPMPENRSNTFSIQPTKPPRTCRHHRRFGVSPCLNSRGSVRSGWRRGLVDQQQARPCRCRRMDRERCRRSDIPL